MGILTPDQIVHDDIRVINQLTRGAYSEIYRVMKERLGLECLLKVNLPHELIAKDAPDPAYEFTKKDHKQRTRDEAQMLKEFIGVPNIVQMTDLIDFWDYSGILFGPIKPLPIRGTPTMREFTQSYNQQKASDLQKMGMFVELAKGLISALFEMNYPSSNFSKSGSIHGPGIVHRDIRPENIIISDRYIPILIDFGLAVKSDQVETGVWGSKSYAPPEIYYHKGNHNSDCWHVGLILYEFLTNEHLIDNSPDVVERRKKIVDKVKSLDNKISIIQFYEELIQKFSNLEKYYLKAEIKYSEMGKPDIVRTPDFFREFGKHLAMTALFCEPVNILRLNYARELCFLDEKKCGVAGQLEEHLKLVKEL